MFVIVVIDTYVFSNIISTINYLVDKCLVNQVDKLIPRYIKGTFRGTNYNANF